MFYTQSHLRYAILPKTPTDSRRHGLSKQIVREMPILLETPAVVMRSLTQPSRVVCMLPQVDNNRLPLIAVINLGLHDKLCVWGVSPMCCCRGWCGGVR
ncbi:hypothetical protein, partial [uncultured Mobiluncus sp.]